jgi:hypothetical protein
MNFESTTLGCGEIAARGEWIPAFAGMTDFRQDGVGRLRFLPPYSFGSVTPRCPMYFPARSA